MPNRKLKDEDEKMTGKDKKASKKPLPPSKKRSGAAHDDDDSSVDSHGNIRGLIAYDSEEDYTESESEESERPKKSSKKQEKKSPRKTREAALIARKRIQKKLKKEEEAEARKKAAKKRKVESETESEEDEEDGETLGSQDTDEEDEDEEEEEEEEDYDGDEEDESHQTSGGNLVITFGGSEEGADPMVPIRHNMKKESAAVKKFVKLITSPVEDNTIDTQIDQFKELKEDKQEELLKALERRPTQTDTGVNLMLRILTLKLSPDIQAMILAKYNALQNLDPSTGEYFKLRNWLDKAVAV